MHTLLPPYRETERTLKQPPYLILPKILLRTCFYLQRLGLEVFLKIEFIVFNFVL